MKKIVILSVLLSMLVLPAMAQGNGKGKEKRHNCREVKQGKK
jgi:hypothetical protein